MMELGLLLISGIFLFGGAAIIVVQTREINRSMNRVWSGISFMMGGLLVQVIIVLVMLNE